ncbi:MAG: TonB-dependent receptor, partial [Balneolaceae bacterium]|nr:TonB-dependent receptor [Balneolaceae bacterium]
MSKFYSFRAALVAAFILLISSSPLYVHAQTVTGVVKDAETNEPLAGASVVQEGTQRGTSTRADGSFSLTLIESEDPVLSVRFVGYSQQTYTVEQFDEPVAIQLEPNTIQGDKVFVEDVRADETAPVSQTTINRKKIEEDNVGQDPVFTLARLTPSVLTHSDSGTRFANYSYMRLRGMDQTRINMTLNGVPLNDMIDQGVFFSNFNDFGNFIQSVQVQRGVGTSTHGTSSYAGSINFESKNITMGGPSAGAKVTGGSFGSHRISGKVSTGSMNNFGFFSRFSRTASDGYRYHSGTESNTFFASGGYFGEKDIIKVTAFFGRTKNELAYTPVPIDQIRQDPRTNTISKNDIDDFGQQLIQLQYNRAIHEGLSLNSTIYYGGAGGNFPVGFDDGSGNFVQQIFSLENDHYGLKSSLHYDNGEGFELSGGIHTYRFDRINQESFEPRSEVLTYADDSRKDEFSAFAKATYELDDLELYGDIQVRSVWLSLNPDVSFLTDAGIPENQTNVPTREYLFVNPKVGMTYHLSDKVNVYGSFGRSGREPTRQDILGATNINPSNLDVVQDPNSVKAEYVNDYEGGIRVQTSRFAGKLNGFFMQFRNEISPTGEFIPEGFVQLRENISESYRAGVELQWQWRVIDPISFSGNATWMQTNIERFTPGASGQVYRNVESILSPNWLGNATVTYRAFEWMDVSLSGRYMGEAYLELTNNPAFVMPSFFKADLGMEFQVSSAVSASLKVNNLFDKLYFTYGAPLDTNFDGTFDTPGYIVQPPRHAF